MLSLWRGRKEGLVVEIAGVRQLVGVWVLWAGGELQRQGGESFGG